MTPVITARMRYRSMEIFRKTWMISTSLPDRLILSAEDNQSTRHSVSLDVLIMTMTASICLKHPDVPTDRHVSGVVTAGDTFLQVLSDGVSVRRISGNLYASGGIMPKYVFLSVVLATNKYRTTCLFKRSTPTSPVEILRSMVQISWHMPVKTPL